MTATEVVVFVILSLVACVAGVVLLVVGLNRVDAARRGPVGLGGILWTVGVLAAIGLLEKQFHALISSAQTLVAGIELLFVVTVAAAFTFSHVKLAADAARKDRDHMFSFREMLPFGAAVFLSLLGIAIVISVSK